MSIKSINPATGEIVEQFEALGPEGIDLAIERSSRAFEILRKQSVAQRADKMAKAAGILELEKDQLGRLLTEEMGKTLKAAVAEVEKCAWVCRYYAEQADSFLADEPIETDASRAFVRHLPLGPVLAIMPWNFPFWQVFRFAAPALMAGNTGLLKHASNVPRAALAIESVFKRAGFEDGAFITLLTGPENVEQIIQDDRVRAATLTGSEGAGRAVGSLAGKAIKPTVLELGGSDPFIVMPSADLDAAVEAAVTARTINNGQSCIAAKRFIVHEEVYDAFVEGFVARFEALKVGDPMEEATDIGPLATGQIRDEIVGQVQKSLNEGASRLFGGELVDGPGYFFQPGVLAQIPESAPAYGEEVFGPVAMLFKAASLDEAIAIGNATRFGLGSSIWTRDAGEIEQAANDIEAGATFVNSFVASDPRLPFGGVKASGYGRELSRDGIRAFVNRKTVSVA